jgi:hypothetical protein
MHTSQDSAPAQRSTAERLLIRSWEYRHMRAWAGFRIGGGVALTTCGALTLAFGGSDRKTYGWAALFLVPAALNFAYARWQLAIARSASPRT